MIRHIDNECDYGTKASVGYTEGLQEETRRITRRDRKINTKICNQTGIDYIIY